MNIRTQISSRQTEPSSRAARKTSARAPQPREAAMSFDKGWNVSKKMICLGLAVLIWYAANTGYAITGYAIQTTQTAEISPGEDIQSDHIVTGTLDQLDFNTGKGLLRTDLGKSIFFQMVRPELFKRLSVGQRVTIGMNEQGQAVKVMEVPPVELPIPPSPVQ